MLRVSVALAVLTFGIAAASGWAQAPAAPQRGPPGPPPNGEQLYMENCAECHGPEGDVVPDVDLGHGRFRRATTDPELVGIVLRGIPNTAMPPSNFSEAQASAIVQFLRAKAPAVRPRARATPRRASAIFTGKGNCTSCHRVNGIGSRVRPGSERDRPAAALDRHRERDPRSRRAHRPEQPLRAARHARWRDDYRAHAESGRLHRAAPRLERAAAIAACAPT